MNQARYKTVRHFLLRFTLIYGLLIVPWPGVNETYGAFFRALAGTVFSAENGSRELGFSSLPPARGLNLTRIEIVNRTLMAGDGSGPVRNLDVDTGGFWRTAALLIALVIATPVAWRRRARALLWGCLWVHGFILLAVGFSIWNESRYVSLVTLSPFWASFADKLQEMLISQFSIAAPVVIWVLVTFRREDLETLKLQFGAEKPA